MERLTMKLENGMYVAPNITNTDELKNKLGQLEDIEQELGIELSVLFKALKSKQCGLRYFDKTDAFVNKCEVGWYVQMIMYGWIPLKDFIKSLTKEELEK